MARFHYRACTRGGEAVAGFAEADSAQGVAVDLLRQGLTIVSIRPQSALRQAWAVLNADFNLRASLSSAELGAFSSELGSLTEAGIAVDAALRMMQPARRSKRAAAMIAELLSRLQDRQSLSDALQQHAGRFPAAFVAQVRASESSGQLGTTLVQAAADIARQQQFLTDLRNALLYPAFLTIASTGALIVLLTVVVPSIEGLLSGMPAGRLPVVTGYVMALSHICRDWGQCFALGTVGATIVAIVAMRTAAARLAVAHIMRRLPIVGPIVVLSDASRFFGTLANLIGGGVRVNGAVALAADSTKNAAIRTSLRAVHKRLSEGTSLSHALSEVHGLPADAPNLIHIGEQTGRLQDFAARAAQLYEVTCRNRLKAAMTMLGPGLTVVFGTFAGLIIYAIMTTILSINEMAFQ